MAGRLVILRSGRWKKKTALRFFVRGIGCAWFWFFAAGLLPCSGGTLETPTVSARLEDGALFGLANRLTGESFDAEGRPESHPAALRLKGHVPMEVGDARERSDAGRIEQDFVWNQRECRWRTLMTADPGSGDLLIAQEGESADKGLVGVSWGIAGIPDQFDVLVPAISGQRFGGNGPEGRWEFQYPTQWESPFVVIQGRQGGWLIRAEEAAHRFRMLVLEHRDATFWLRFESHTFGPFEERGAIESVQWRISPYRGTWQVPAGAMARRVAGLYQPIPLARQQPDWVDKIGLVVVMHLDWGLLPALSRACEPSQTLIYLYHWRNNRYDRNYPDYTPNKNFREFVDRAHKRGFKVMPHINYFGCNPKNQLYEELQQWQIIDPFTGKGRGWKWEKSDPPISYAYISPASTRWRDLLVEKMVTLVREYDIDALHLDQNNCIFNDANGDVDGLNPFEGNILLHRQLRSALPDVAFGGEGLNEVTLPFVAFAQRHVRGIDFSEETWDESKLMMSHPISSAVFSDFTRMIGYQAMSNPSNEPLYNAWRRAYVRYGTLPTFKRPKLAQVELRQGLAEELLNRAQFFQRYLPEPDFQTPWRPGELFVYRLNDGRRAAYVYDRGIHFRVE
jgi:hypothetical protein